MEDVWVKRINAITDGVAKIIIAAASIIAAWQSTLAANNSRDNARDIQVMRQKQDQQMTTMGIRP